MNKQDNLCKFTTQKWKWKSPRRSRIAAAARNFATKEEENVLALVCFLIPHNNRIYMQNIGCVHVTYNRLLIYTRLVCTILHKDINNVRLYRIRRFSATQYRLYEVGVETLWCGHVSLP